MNMYVWSSKPNWIAVAYADSVAHARELLVSDDCVGESGDGSCPVRDRARHHILNMMPSIWSGPNAEFELTDSAALEEADAENTRLKAEIEDLKNSLKAERTIADERVRAARGIHA